MILKIAIHRLVLAFVLQVLLIDPFQMDLLEALALSLDVRIDRTAEGEPPTCLAFLTDAPPATAIEAPLAVLADAPPTIPEVPGLRGGKRKYFVSYVDGKRQRHLHFGGPVPLGERLAKAREKKQAWLL